VLVFYIAGFFGKKNKKGGAKCSGGCPFPL